MGRLTGRTIIVTGAAQGIGASYARSLAAEGASVAICDVTPPTSIVAEIGRAAWGSVCDVSASTSVGAFVAEVVNRFGRIDGLVNNAAIFTSLKPKPFELIDSDEFDRVLQVNVRGIFECARAVLPTMRAQKYGKIVNISSGTFYKGTPGMAHYVASKGAVIALSRVMAREVGRDGIRVNCVAPGFTLSEGVRNWEAPGDLNAINVASRCIARDQMPEDLNGAIAFLVSADSDFITGQTLIVDGGSAMS